MSAPVLGPCPFCGSRNIDPEGWARDDGTKGPACDDCGATAESAAAWNRRTPSPAPAVPEPTSAMIQAGMAEMYPDATPERVAAIYRAMRAAAPSPAAPDMWWPINDLEDVYGSPEEWADDVCMQAGEASTLTFTTAFRGPNITVTVAAIGNDETDDVEYRVAYDAPTPPTSGGA